jgi:uncharacterized protein (TIGR00661 family)
MMSVLYGFQSTGNGHFSRALTLVPRLKTAGMDLDVISSGTTSESASRRHPDLEPYKAFHGLNFKYGDGGISYLGTLAAFRPFQLWDDYQSIDGPYDLVITDFEPISAWWGRMNGVKTIGIAHQYTFWGDAPRPPFRDPFAELVFQNYAPVDVPLGLHWQRCTPTTLPPIIRPEIREAEVSTAEHVLVYLPAYIEETIDAIFSAPELAVHNIIAYPNRKDYVPEGENVVIKEFSSTGFIKDLASARAVVCCAGFTLLSECLYLGKPVISVPIWGQYEQTCNVVALEEWGLGESIQSPRPDVVAGLIEDAKPVSHALPDPTDKIVEWLSRGMKETPEELSETVWEE